MHAPAAAAKKPSPGRRAASAGGPASGPQAIRSIGRMPTPAGGSPAAARCTCGGGCPRCASAVQRKAVIGSTADASEREADAIAEQLLRTPAPEPVAAAPGVRTETPRILRRAHRAAADGAAPPIVDAALGTAGTALDRGSRSYFEPRLGRDLGAVRLHTGGLAAASAAAIGARAYTAGAHIVFGERFVPTEAGSRALLVHELVHVVQQAGGTGVDAAPLIQRAPCMSGSLCASTAGDASTFGAGEDATEDALATASGGSAPVGGGPITCNAPRHRDRATHFESLATNAGLDAAIVAGIDGYFIDGCLSPGTGALTDRCDQFRNGAPAGTNGAHKCVHVHASDEDLAQRLEAQGRPFNDADLHRFLGIVATVTHESQHVVFDANPGAIATPAADCTVSTAIASGGTVSSRLTEISAETAEFHPYFRERQLRPTASSRNALATEEHDIASRGGENILGNLRSLKCTCSCATVDRFVEQVFAQASTSWTDDERLEFKRAMTDFIPGFWPRSLQAQRPPRTPPTSP